MKQKKTLTRVGNNIEYGKRFKFEMIILASIVLYFNSSLSAMASGLEIIPPLLIQSHLIDESTLNHNIDFYVSRVFLMKNISSSSELSEQSKKLKLTRILSDLRARTNRQLDGLPSQVVGLLDQTIFSNLNEAQELVRVGDLNQLSEILKTSEQTLRSLKTK